MKKHLLLFFLLAFSSLAFSQLNCYWVFFTDKNGSEFDPYSYFDAKAIARYVKCGASLYDSSNYPVNATYMDAVADMANETVGSSRWLNAVGIMASTEAAARITALPFVDRLEEIAHAPMTLAAKSADTADEILHVSDSIIHNQLKRFGGRYFIEKGIDGKGLRIAVLDGGFPHVDTHPAFQHLRDGKQIIATYNFPKKCENVYGWDSHGTMVLSCIAGMMDNVKLGLATGAEFLLARTEIDPEPFKEEIWWAQGAEWADKNGADIINSSLGYGKDRYYTRQMDGTSYVAKAANMAVEKGILVCNAAGNEGDDSRWMTIITPSDAENVLCVGGIEAGLEHYKHIAFSSYGPTSDKRRKPNVCAFGYAEVANPSNGYTHAFGTSFASPLTAGFCACAWQTRRDLNALQMKAEIEKSGDLYPYFDYAFGYGVPQAAFFTGNLENTQPSFEILENTDSMSINVLDATGPVFVNIEGDNGILIGYYQFSFPSNKDRTVSLSKTQLGNGKKINVSHNGYFRSHAIENQNNTENTPSVSHPLALTAQNGTFPEIRHENLQSTVALSNSFNIPDSTWNRYSPSVFYHWRWLTGKTYKIGVSLGFGFCNYQSTRVLTGHNDRITMKSFALRGEIFHRIVNRMWGVNWDLGAYGDFNGTRKIVHRYDETCMEPHVLSASSTLPYDKRIKTIYSKCKHMNRFQYGLITRFSYTILNQINIGFTASYRFSKVITGEDPLIGKPDHNPSPWQFGLEFELLK